MQKWRPQACPQNWMTNTLYKDTDPAAPLNDAYHGGVDFPARGFVRGYFYKEVGKWLSLTFEYE